MQLNGPEYWRFNARKYTENYQKNHLLCDTKFRPQTSNKVVDKNEKENDEFEEINLKTSKSYFGQSTLF